MFVESIAEAADESVIVFKLFDDDAPPPIDDDVVIVVAGNIISVSFTDDCSTTTHDFVLSSKTFEVNVVVVSATFFLSTILPFLIVFDEATFLEAVDLISLLSTPEVPIEDEENSW
jgi:hypothetical protein